MEFKRKTEGRGARHFGEERFRSLRLLGSYLGRQRNLPWKESDAEDIERAIRHVLVRIWGNRAAQKAAGQESPDLPWPSQDAVYQPAAVFDRSGAFRNAVHLGWHGGAGLYGQPMPVSAARLNIEMRDADVLKIMTRAAKCLSRVVAAGHRVSVKLTETDFQREYRHWQRLVVYVPTCALRVLMNAFAPFFEDGLLQWHDSVRAGEFYGDYYILLPRFCSLRGTGEGGETSPAQFWESLSAVRAAGVLNQVVTRTRAH